MWSFCGEIKALLVLLYISRVVFSLHVDDIALLCRHFVVS